MTLHALIARPVPADTLPPTVVITVEVTVPVDGLPTMQDAVERFIEYLGTTPVSVVREPARVATGHPVDLDRTIQVLPRLRAVRQGATEFTLTRREFDLLLFFARHPGQVFSRAQLLAHVWRHPADSGERTVDVHVTRLRHRLADCGPLLRTIRGVGYRLDERARVAVAES